MGLILGFCAISYIIAKVFEPFVFFDVLVMLYLLRNLRFLREPYTQNFRVFPRLSVSFRVFPCISVSFRSFRVFPLFPCISVNRK